jgi:hypothetical protein
MSAKQRDDFGAKLPDLFVADAPRSASRLVLPFGDGRIEVRHGIFERIEFSGKSCNLTLKNSSTKSQRVRMAIHVLSSHLIELWQESVHWRLKKLQPEQIASETWKFEPTMPNSVCNRSLRDDCEPTWVVIYINE